MSWTAIIPLKRETERKSRLEQCLSPSERIALSNGMAEHVIGVLASTPDISRIAILSPDRIDMRGTSWHRDKGRGLNEELEAVRVAIAGPLLVIHPDLPQLAAEDVAALCAAARSGVAIASDRHRRGTNAVALLQAPGFRFRFGQSSLAAHRSGGAGVVHRPGLACDIDTPQDLGLLCSHGRFRISAPA